MFSSQLLGISSKIIRLLLPILYFNVPTIPIILGNSYNFCKGPIEQRKLTWKAERSVPRQLDSKEYKANDAREWSKNQTAKCLKECAKRNWNFFSSVLLNFQVFSEFIRSCSESSWFLNVFFRIWYFFVALNDDQTANLQKWECKIRKKL